MKVLVYVLFTDLARLEDGEQVEARAHVEHASEWVQVMVDTAEYTLEESGAFFGAPYVLQKKAGGRA